MAISLSTVAQSLVSRLNISTWQLDQDDMESELLRTRGRAIFAYMQERTPVTLAAWVVEAGDRKVRLLGCSQDLYEQYEVSTKDVLAEIATEAVISIIAQKLSLQPHTLGGLIARQAARASVT